jgi:hypothetical protein
MSALCADSQGRCAAMVEREGQRCPVHQKASQGPYAGPCEGCGKPITASDLWVRARRPDRPHDGAEHPWHYACRPGATRPAKATRTKRNWNDGLGLCEKGAR